MPTDHRMVLFSVLLFFPLTSLVQAITLSDYQRQRQLHKDQKTSLSYGSELILTPHEEKVNKILMHAKRREIEESMQFNVFPPSKSFFTSKPLIENSRVFDIIRAMPKGAALHVHDIAMVDPVWLVKNLTYRPNCYVCRNGDDVMAFKFTQTPPSGRIDCKWALLADERSTSKIPDDFDDILLYHMTIEPKNLYTFDPCCVDQSAVWKRAERAFRLASELIFVQPNLGDYYREALRQFIDDGVLYVEPRTLLAETTDVSGNTYGAEEYLNVYKNVSTEMARTSSYFVGSKVIKCDLRFFDVATINRSLSEVMTLRNKYPDFLAGYDLVGQEDVGLPLEQYLDILLRPSQMDPPVDLPYFFHAGETDWFDTVVDWNLLDAILLNTSRIGHGYSLVKHPPLMQLVKERDIPIEVNPISNQVLGLITDLRNHPATYLLANNLSVVVSSDDPALWRSLPLSHDFYQVFMANTGMHDGLRVLKKLALNSIRYSSMSEKEKTRAFDVWQGQWDHFIKMVIEVDAKDPSCH